MDRVQHLLNLLEEDPRSVFILFALAKEYEKRQKYEIAEAYYLRSLELDENYLGSYYHVAKLYEELGDNDQALVMYERGITKAKSLSDFHALGELMNAKTNLEMEL